MGNFNSADFPRLYNSSFSRCNTQWSRTLASLDKLGQINTNTSHSSTIAPTRLCDDNSPSANTTNDSTCSSKPSSFTDAFPGTTDTSERLHYARMPGVLPELDTVGAVPRLSTFFSANTVQQYVFECLFFSLLKLVFCGANVLSSRPKQICRS